MKNLKKVLAMVLAFACTFTMFAGAKVFEDVPAGSDYSEAITMLSDLGVIQGKDDGKYHPEDTITRAEACAMIARLMTGDPNVSQYTGAQNFADVAKGSWKDSAIGYCYINNIVVGVGNNKFEPDRAITDAEFVTMVVRAMGYETPDMTQGYPYSYMSNAQAIGLLDGVNMVASTDALRGEDAQVIYNALFTDYARGAKLVNTTHGTSVESYPTLAESVWGLETAAVGTWTGKDDEEATLTNCKAHTWVVIGAAQDEEGAILAYPIKDDSTDLYKADEKTEMQYATYKFKYEGDVESIKGYKVELWGEGSHGEPTWEKGKNDGTFVYSEDWTIKAIKTVKDQTKYDYNSSMADSKDDNGTIVLDDGTSLKLETVADNAKNVESSDEVPTLDTFLGKSLNTVSITNNKSVEKALNVRNGAQYQLMDWDSDGDVDWVVVDEARYYKVESVSSKRVDVTSMKSDSKLASDLEEQVETWKLDENEKIGTNDAKKDVKIKYEVPDGLEEGDIVEVTYKVTYEGKAQLITATVSVVDAENKTLNEVGTRDGLTLTFDDEEIKVAQNAELGDVIVPENPATYKGFNSEELDTEFALWMNRNGFIVYSDYATETANYMMVLNTAGGKDETGSRELAQIDIVTADNKEMDDVKVASDARVLAQDGSTLKNNNGDAYSSRKFDEEQVVGNVFKYWTDADGVITKMQAVFSASDAAAEATSGSSTKDAYSYDADADRLINKKNGYIASLEDAKVIFAVKGATGYIATNDTTSAPILRGSNLKVNASDVLAVKQADIPDIGGTEPTQDAALLGSALSTDTAWLGTDAASDNAFVVNTNKNSEATAALLGVNNFNKFNAGATKLALVTNVSERSGGVIKATVAMDGEVKTLSSVEKTDFSDVVKVFDGTVDNGVAGPDATISTTNGNDVFDNEKLSDLVNHGGQYAEITTDKDGNLTKVVFMDADETANDNLMTGHYYEVSRNLVLNKSDKNLKYAINDGQNIYNGVTAAQYFASDSKLYTVSRLEAYSKGYTDDAQFYAIDAAPSRHDVDYDATRLTVNAGFDNLSDSRISSIEKGDIAAHEPNLDSTKNYYDVADIAYKIGGDIVAVYSFDSLNEEYQKDVVLLKDATSPAKAEYDATDVIAVEASMADGSALPSNRGLAIYDANGNNITASGQFTVAPNGAGKWNVTVNAPAQNGTYTIKLLDLNNNAMVGSLKFKVKNTTTTTALDVTSVTLGNVSSDGHKFKIGLNGVSPLAAGSVTAKLAAENLAVYRNTSERLTVTGCVETSTTNVYEVTVSETIVAGDKLEVMVLPSKYVTINGATSGNVTTGEQTVTIEGSTSSDLTDPTLREVLTALNEKDEVTVSGKVPTGVTVPANKTLILNDADITAATTISGDGFVKVTGSTIATQDLTVTNLDITDGAPNVTGGGAVKATNVKTGDIAGTDIADLYTDYTATKAIVGAVTGDVTMSSGSQELEAASISGKLTVTDAASVTVTGSVNEIDVAASKAATVGSVTTWSSAKVASGATLTVTESVTEDLNLATDVSGTVAFKKDVAGLTVNNTSATVTVDGNATGTLTVTNANSVTVTGSVDTVELAASKAATVDSVTKWDAATVPSDATLTVKGDVADAITMGTGVAGTVKFDGEVAGLTFGAAAKVEFAQAVDMTKVVGFEGATATFGVTPSAIGTDASGAVDGVFVNTSTVATDASEVQTSEAYTYTAKASVGGGSVVQADFAWYKA